jgi:predicted DNA-binding transcriptional regulator AlpA
MEPARRTRLIATTSAAPVATDERRPLITTIELAAYLRMPAQTVRLWRTKGRGPQFIKMGKHVRYRWVDVEQWEAETVGRATA